MATRSPRLALSLPANTHASLAKLASLQRRPKSAVAADLLVEMTPSLERITKLLEAAMANRAALPGNTAARLESLETLLGSIATLGLDRAEELVSPPPSATRGKRVPKRRGH